VNESIFSMLFFSYVKYPNDCRLMKDETEIKCCETLKLANDQLIKFGERK
jgi:hypothetical protein